LATTGHKFSFNTFIYFWESTLPSTGVNVPVPLKVKHPQNIADTFLRDEWALYIPRHLGFHSSSRFRQTNIFLFLSKTTFVSSLKIMFDHFSSTVHCRLLRHHETRFCRFCFEIIVVLRTMHRLYCKHFNFFLTVVLETSIGILS